MSDNPTIDRLIRRLAHPTYSVRKSVVAQLVAEGDDALPALRQALQSPQYLVQLRVIETLGLLGDAPSFLALKAILFSSSDHEILAETVRALDRIVQKTPNLRSSMDGLEKEYAARVATLSSASYVPLATLRTSFRVSEAARRAPPLPSPFEEPASQSLTGLIKQLSHSRYETRVEAAAELVARGEEAIEPLLEVARGPNPIARVRAIQALGEIADPSSARAVAALDPGVDQDVLEVWYATVHKVVDAVVAQPTSDDIDQLIGLAEQLRVALPAAAVKAARGLEYLAISSPTPALRRALPTLKGGLFRIVPFEFRAIRQVVDEATRQWKDLPLIADAPAPEGHDLPRPAAEPEHD